MPPESAKPVSGKTPQNLPEVRKSEPSELSSPWFERQLCGCGAVATLSSEVLLGSPSFPFLHPSNNQHSRRTNQDRENDSDDPQDVSVLRRRRWWLIPCVVQSGMRGDCRNSEDKHAKGLLHLIISIPTPVSGSSMFRSPPRRDCLRPP